MFFGWGYSSSLPQKINKTMSCGWLLVTGASKGLGKAFAVTLAQELKPEIVFLTARRVESLERTQAEIMDLFVDKPPVVVAMGFDFEEEESTERMWEEISSAVRARASEDEPLGCGVVVENAGVLKPLGRLGEEGLSRKEIAKSVSVNGTHFATSLDRFLGVLRDLPEPDSPHLFVNISSLAAIKPFPSWGIYCAGKAFRDMLVATAAEEQASKSDSLFKALNYAPGPCDTDMQGEIRDDGHVDASIVEIFSTMKAEGKLVTPIETAKALSSILVKNDFKSGAHIDYFDVQE